MEGELALKRLTESADFSDVTLAHCKSKACLKRHPKVCKFFTSFNSCKFGEHCAYKHVTSSKQDTIDELSVKLASLENAVKEITHRIECLEKVIEKLTKESKSSVPCNQCDYKASSEVVLKRHITTKHKELEIEREMPEGNDLQTSLPLEERAAEPNTSPPRAAGPSYTYTCLICDDEYMGSENFKNHMVMVHKLGGNTNKCFICGEVLTSTHRPKVCDFCIDNCRPEYLKVFI